MKNLYITIIIFGMLGTMQGQGFYDIDTINTIEITFQESNWDYLLDSFVSAGQEERLMGSVSINGVVYDSVGVRYKGNSTYSASRVKNPLNIKLDYIIDDQEVEGYGTLKLANNYKDPSFVRETMNYEIARKYFPAGESNYANVYINGTHLGLYTNDQDVDKYFMRTHFSSDENVRFKGEVTTGNPGSMGGVWEYFGTDSSDYYNYYAIESDYGWDELIDFLDTVNNHNSYVDQILNIDRHLWFLAFSNLIVNLDGPINNPQNYYIYKDDNGLMNPIPWDMNESYGVFSILESGGPPLSTTQLQQLSPYLHLTSSEHPIISKILSNSSYKRMYVAHMKTIMEENFSNGLYLSRALEIQDIIDTDVQADANKFYTYSNFIDNLYYSVGGGGWPPSSEIIGINELMADRTTYLSGLSDFQATAPQISNINNSPQQVTPNIELWIVAEVASATEVYLGYRQSVTEQFVKTQMFDDGVHNDGSAGDGVYGASIITGYTDLQYYIYADNGNAASFSPERAEYEFHSISITSDLVINEFLADNETTVADQNGEYDDWIEILNSGESAIDLHGFYLSDDAADQDQWTFPDTTIDAGAYLVVWADNDEEQEGLHSNFKLSSSGESIFLSDTALQIVDEITFGAQKADTTYGRYPNGTGDFSEMPPTFGSENEPFGTIHYDDLVINEFLTDNENTVQDQNGEYDDWIEFYNKGNTELPLLGLYLSDDTLDPGQWTFPDTTIAAGNYLIVWADNDEVQEGLHANFKLSASGESIILSDTAFNVIDEITFGAQKVDTTNGRYPNGTGDFSEMPPTFESRNEPFGGIQYNNLVINEFLADNASTASDQNGEYDDWIEFYNNGITEIPLLDVYLSDDSLVPGQWSFPDTTIAAGGYLIVWADNDEGQEGLHTNFKLSASGDKIILSDPDLDLIDEISFGQQLTDTSTGRYPNGIGYFMEMQPTFSAENYVSTEVQYDDLVINEFLTDNEATISDQNSEYDDWIELFNNGDSALPLSGTYLSDDYDIPGQWAFPDTTIAAGGYLIVWADNDEEQEGLHANFKLSASGETVLITDIGWNTIDSVDYGAQKTDTTYGRYPNGTGSFTEMLPSFASENQYSINNLSVQNDTVNNGETNCYDATDTIIVAGSGSIVEIFSGGEATFIAGAKIVFETGFKSHEGSYALAYITTTGEYCDQAQSMMANTVNTDPVEKSLSIIDGLNTGADIKIYPNPSSGKFTIDFMGEETTAEIIVLNFQGNKINSLVCQNQTKTVIDISALPNGIYVVVIKLSDQMVTKKIIKTQF